MLAAVAAASSRARAAGALPAQTIILEIKGKDRPASAKAAAGRQKHSVPVKVRIDTPIEVDYYRHGWILPFVLRQLLSR
jgi:aconitase A